jgi:hypothetical protein
VEFLQALLVEFGFEPFRMRKIELLSILKDFMIEQYANGKKLLLVIDEAQNLSRKVLEEVRMLSGIEAQKEKLLRIILAGQPELSDKLDSPRLEQLTQRVRLRFHLSSLSKRETMDYIGHRLEIAGARGRKIFSDEACDMVFRYSGGIPRLTNIICDTAMLCAFAEEKDAIDTELVAAAAEELQWKVYTERSKGNGVAPRDGQTPAPIGTAMARFEIFLQETYLQHFDLPLGRAIVGRTPDNDLQISSKFISRHHAQIVTSADRCVLEDLNSTNGVFLLTKRVKHHVLRDGDVVQLGEHRLVYHDLRRSALEDEFDTDATGPRFPKEFDEDFDEDNEEDEEDEELEVEERSVRAE